MPLSAGTSLGVTEYLYAASANGMLIYQTGGAGSSRQLRWFDRSGKEEEALGGADWLGSIKK